MPNQYKPKIITAKAPQRSNLQQTHTRCWERRAGKERSMLRQGDHVRYLHHDQTWKHGKIHRSQVTGPRDYTIINDNNKNIRRNRIHLFKIPPPISKQITKERPNNDTINRAELISAKTPYITRVSRIIRPVQRLGIE